MLRNTKRLCGSLSHEGLGHRDSPALARRMGAAHSEVAPLVDDVHRAEAAVNDLKKKLLELEREAVTLRAHMPLADPLGSDTHRDSLDTPHAPPAERAAHLEVEVADLYQQLQIRNRLLAEFGRLAKENGLEFLVSTDLQPFMTEAFDLPPNSDVALPTLLAALPGPDGAAPALASVRPLPPPHTPSASSSSQPGSDRP